VTAFPAFRLELHEGVNGFSNVLRRRDDDRFELADGHGRAGQRRGFTMDILNGFAAKLRGGLQGPLLP
jgi:hypothetical protein